MNEIVDKFLLSGHKCMPQMHLKQPGFTYGSCGPFTKNKERIQKFKETRDTNYIYKNELDKACFQHDMTYGDFKDLARRTVSDKLLSDKAFSIAKNPKYDRYQRGLACMLYNFFDKKTSGSGVATLANKSAASNKIKQNQQSAGELHEPIIKKIIVNSSFKDNIWGADLAEMQLISKFNKGIRFLLCVMGIYSKYAWVVHLKDKKGVSIVNTFQKILDDSVELHSKALKPNKICDDKGK